MAGLPSGLALPLLLQDMPTISLVLAGVPFKIETQSLRLTDLFTDYYRYYSPCVVDDHEHKASRDRNDEVSMRLTLECVDELPQLQDYLPPASTLLSRTGVLELWESRGGETELAEYYFGCEVASFHVNPARGTIKGLVAPSAFKFPHILANTYSLFPVLLILRSLGLYHLHAAAVVSPRGEVWLIPGSQRSGKTTIATALGLAGWRPVSDDSLLLRVDRCEAGSGSFEILALRKYFHLGNELLDRWPHLQGIERRHSYLDRTCVAALEFFSQPKLDGASIAGVDFLLLPRISGEAESRLKQVSPSTGLLMLGEQSVFLQMWGQHTSRQWGGLERIVQGARCFGLESGVDLLEDPLLLASMLEGVEPSA